MTKKQKREVEYALGRIKETNRFIQGDSTIVCTTACANENQEGAYRCIKAGKLPEGTIVNEIAKDIGSPLQYLDVAIKYIEAILYPPRIRVEDEEED